MYADPIATATENEPAGTYWTPPIQVNLAEICPTLMAKVLMADGYQTFPLYCALAFDMESGAPIGQFEIAIDKKAGRAFGFLNRWKNDTPRVIPFIGDEQAAIEALYNIEKANGDVE